MNRLTGTTCPRLLERPFVSSTKLGLAAWMVSVFVVLLACVLAGQPAAIAQDNPGQDAESDEPVVAESMSIEQLTELAAQHPADPNVAFNLGLAHATADNLGLATLYLERAHLLHPLDRELGDVLLEVRREARRRRAEAMPNATLTEGEPTALFWWRFFSAVSERTYAILLLLGVWLCCGLLFVWRRLPRSPRRDVVGVAASIFALAALSALSMWIGMRNATRHQPAVIVAESPTYHDAPDELTTALRQPNLYEGAVALIREARDGWLRVELVDGEEVWVRPDVAVPVMDRD